MAKSNQNETLISLFICIIVFVDVGQGRETVNISRGDNGGDEPSAPAMFILGDSLVDCGNNNFLPTIARANYYPYGIDFGVPTGRFCNGLTVADFGAKYLGLPLVPPYLSPFSTGKAILRGLNYASAAAGILDDTGKQYGGRSTFTEQILQFETTVKIKLQAFFENSTELNQYIEKSVFMISIGSNDYINNYLVPIIYDSSYLYTGEEFADILVTKLSTQLSNLYRLGARKIAVFEVGPLGCIPNQISRVSNSTNNGSCVDQVNNLVTIFNTKVDKLIKTLNASLPGSFFVHQKVYDLTYSIINNPSKYGFLVPNIACCGNGNNGGEFTCLPFQKPCNNRHDYVFWDSYHPTEDVNAVVAERSFTEFRTTL